VSPLTHDLHRSPRRADGTKNAPPLAAIMAPAAAPHKSRVLVVGAGFAGVALAIKLAAKGFDVTLLDR